MHGTIIGPVTAAVPVIATAGASVEVSLYVDAGTVCGNTPVAASGIATLTAGQASIKIALANAHGLTPMENIELGILPVSLVSSPHWVFGPWGRPGLPRQRR